MDDKDASFAKEMQDIFNSIESGVQQHDEQQIRDAIVSGEALLPRLSSKPAIGQLYSKLGNAQTDLFLLFAYQNNVKRVPQSEALQQAKAYYRKALDVLQNEAPQLKKQVWVNFGNCLEYLGRGMESLYAYDEALRIDPKFAMAIANKAITARHFASISGSFTAAIHIDAYHSIKSVINDEELVAIGGLEARQHFMAVLQEIEAQVTDKQVLTKRVPHPRYDDTHFSAFEKFYIQFCIRQKLFLNFHVHDDTCKAAIVDPIFISITTPLDDTTTFYNLARYINQIKEDYAVARLLLVQSQLRRKDLDRLSERTTFVNPLDYSQWHLYYGLLKSAFKETFNILDKIAVFLNRYYALGLREQRVSFDSIWLKDTKKDAAMREALLDSENMSLYALYDIFQDFQSGYYQTLKDIRNALTHRQLSIVEISSAGIQKDGDLLCVRSDEMLKQTIQLMRLVKAAIIYLVNAVTIQEKKKQSNADIKTLIIPADTKQFLPFLPEEEKEQ